MIKLIGFYRERKPAMDITLRDTPVKTYTWYKTRRLSGPYCKKTGWMKTSRRYHVVDGSTDFPSIIESISPINWEQMHYYKVADETKQYTKVYDFDNFTYEQYCDYLRGNYDELPLKLVIKTHRKYIKSQIMKPVDHVRFSAFVVGGLGFIYNNKYDPRPTGPDKCKLPAAYSGTRYTYMPPFQSSSNEIPKGYPIQDLWERYIYDNLPQFPQDDLSITEIHKSLIQNLDKLESKFSDISANLAVGSSELRQTILEILPRITGLNPILSLAQAWLWYSFSIKPTISDIKEMATISSNIDKMVNDWNRQAGKVQTFHVHIKADSYQYTESRNILWEVPRAISPYADYYCPHNRHYTLSRTYRLTIKIRGRKIAQPKSAILLQKLGFKSPLAFMWEKIPFSFVIDWFADISGFLSEIESPTRFLQYDIIDAMWSLKEDYVIKTVPIKDDHKKPRVVAPESFQRLTRYKRERIDPQIFNDQYRHYLKHWEPESHFSTQTGITALSLAAILSSSHHFK
jgi:hypothetical protein